MFCSSAFLAFRLESVRDRSGFTVKHNLTSSRPRSLSVQAPALPLAIAFVTALYLPAGRLAYHPPYLFDWRLFLSLDIWDRTAR